MCYVEADAKRAAPYKDRRMEFEKFNEIMSRSRLSTRKIYASRTVLYVYQVNVRQGKFGYGAFARHFYGGFCDSKAFHERDLSETGFFNILLWLSVPKRKTS